MPLTYPLFRLRQLWPTVRRVYREEGSARLLYRFGRWLAGERGQAQRRPPQDQAALWQAWCEAQMMPDPIDEPYVCQTRFTLCRVSQAADERDEPPLTRPLSEAADWILFVSDGVEILPHTFRLLDEAAQNHPDAEVIYGDYLCFKGSQLEPRFRPALVGPLLLCDNVLAPLALVRVQAVDAVGGLSQADALNLWALALRLQQRAGDWMRIPLPLALIKTPLSSMAALATPLHAPPMETLLADHLNSLGLYNISLSAAVTNDNVIPSFTWALPTQHRVSIIIPNRDQPALLHQCLDSVLSRTIYDDFEVIVVDTGSTDPQTEAIYARLAAEPRFRLLRYAATPFNFSRACNLGAQHATGDLLLFLNNDTQVLTADWLHQMAQWFALPTTGIVGARLLYPDGTLQHSGVTVGLWGLAGHTRTGMTADHTSVLGSDAWPRRLLAVTGACLMIERSVFAAVGGWDESYQLNFSDVQLCLDVHARGAQVLYAPAATLIHHEGQTHQRRVPRADLLRAREKFAPWLLMGDPSYHPALSYRTPHFAPNADGHTPALLNHEVMQRLPAQEWIQV